MRREKDEEKCISAAAARISRKTSILLVARGRWRHGAHSPTYTGPQRWPRHRYLGDGCTHTHTHTRVHTHACARARTIVYIGIHKYILYFIIRTWRDKLQCCLASHVIIACVRVLTKKKSTIKKTNNIITDRVDTYYIAYNIILLSYRTFRDENEWLCIHLIRAKYILW